MILKTTITMNRLFQTETLSEILAVPESKYQIQRVFGDYIYKNDLHILVGDSNVGKTILAMDIALMLSGHNFWDSDDKKMCEAKGKVLYLDFEMQNSQIYWRYHSKLKSLGKNIIRANLSVSGYGANKNAVMEELQTMIESNKPSLIIIDNLSSLLNNSGSYKETNEVMLRLKAMKDSYDTTIIAIAHCKKRKKDKPIEMNSIYGSSAISKLADSISALGESAQDPSLKYLKMLKTRSSRKTDDVALLKVETEPYLHLHFQEWDVEEAHLANKVKGRPRSAITDETRDLILKLKEKNLPIREIEAQTGCSRSSIGRFLKSLKEDNNTDKYEK